MPVSFRHRNWAFSFALARINEYEADKISADLSGSQSAGNALVAIHVYGPYLNEYYWSQFFNNADRFPEPQNLPWSGLKDYVKKHDFESGILDDLLAKNMEEETGYGDTHPSLRDRLAALDHRPEIPQNIKEQSAAELWLAGELDGVLHDFDDDWREGNLENWKSRYEKGRRANLA